MRGTMIIYKPGAGKPERREFARAPTLEELQGAVGGYIEKVPYFESTTFLGAPLRCVALCNEDGKRLVIEGVF